MFQAGVRYRHQNGVDVDLVVFGVLNRGDDRVELRVAWCMRKDGRLLFFDNVIIQRKDFAGWTSLGD